MIPQSFDNIFTAMGALYEISTTEGWLDVMIAAIDQRYLNRTSLALVSSIQHTDLPIVLPHRGPDMQPVKNNQPAWVLFFVMFMLLVITTASPPALV